MNDPTSVVGRRVVAFLVDALVVLALFAAVWQSQAHYVDTAGTGLGQVCDLIREDSTVSQCIEVGDRAYFLTDGDAAGTFGFGLVLQLGYFVVLQGLTGVTLGKLVTGLRTVGEDGRPPGPGRALVRWLVLAVDSFPYVAPLVGFVLALTTPGHRRLGDMAAKTFVVQRAAAGAPPAVPGVTAPPPGAWVPPPPGWGPPSAPGGWGPGAPGPGGWGPPAGGAGGAWGPPTTGTPGGWDAPASAPGPWAPPGAGQEWQAPPPATRPAGDDRPGWGAAAPVRPGDDRSADDRPGESEPAVSGVQETGDHDTGTVTYEPQWDEARGTYIQWDPDRARWLQWEQGPQRWVEIPGQ